MIVQRLDAHTRSTEVRANQSYSRFIRIIAKLRVGPCNRTLGGKISSHIAVIDSTHGDDATQLSRVLQLIRIKVGRRTAGGNTDVIGDRAIELDMAFIACAYGSNNACIHDRDAATTQQLSIRDLRVDHAQRHADEVATMFNTPLHSPCDVDGSTKAFCVDALDTHQGGLRSHASQGTCRAIAQHSAGTMSAMTFIVHRVVIAIDNIVAMMRKGFTTIPKMIRHIKVTVVDT